MAKYQNVPVVVDAEQLLADAAAALKSLALPAGVIVESPGTPRYFIATQQGRVELHLGDWILTDANGNKTAMPDAAFKAAYQSVDAVQVSPAVTG